MEVKIVLKEWKVIQHQDTRTIGGIYEVRAGATVVSTQSFNKGEYNEQKVPISINLLLEAENLTNKIAKEVESYFTGKE